MTDLISESINDEGVCTTALATPDLLKRRGEVHNRLFTYDFSHQGGGGRGQLFKTKKITREDHTSGWPISDFFCLTRGGGGLDIFGPF